MFPLKDTRTKNRLIRIKVLKILWKKSAQFRSNGIHAVDTEGNQGGVYSSSVCAFPPLIQ